MREVLSLAAEQRVKLREVVQRSAAWRPDSIVLRSTLGAPQSMDVIAEITRPDGNGSNGYSRRVRTGQFKAIRMPVFDRFRAVEQTVRPAGYLLPPSYATLVPLLQLQGVQVELLGAVWQGEVEGFTIDSVQAFAAAFEGHRAVTIQGRWTARSATLAAGRFYVSTDQRAGVLAAVLLEPGSEDGLLTWNAFDRELRPRGEAPVLRIRQALVGPKELLKSDP